MTAERLDQIEARANAATKGTWTRMGTDDECYIIVQESGDLLAPFNDYTENHDLTDADADFIAHARSDVPWLIEQVRFLLGELAAAVADNEKKDAALRAVLDRHEPETRWQSDPDSEWSYDTPEDAAAYEEMDPAECTSFVICRECGRVEKADAERQDHGEFSGYAESLYPCPTVRAIEEALS